MKNVVENTDAGNTLPIRLRKPGETASKQVLPAKSTISAAETQNKQRSKATPNNQTNKTACKAHQEIQIDCATFPQEGLQHY